MRRVILESPFKGNAKHDEQDHIAYARECLYDCLMRGEAPLASHILYTQVLDEASFEERQLGIAAGMAWHPVAECIVVYTDYGISSGMKAAIASAENANFPIEYRSLVKAKTKL